jgi:hypothetical protein
VGSTGQKNAHTDGLDSSPIGDSGRLILPVANAIVHEIQPSTSQGSHKLTSRYGRHRRHFLLEIHIRIEETHNFTRTNAPIKILNQNTPHVWNETF